MWPWEHLAFGYLWYSTYSHVVRREAPTTGAALAAGGAALLPDIVDKPLAWGLDVLPAGRSLAHSLVVAVPLVVLAVVLARRTGYSREGEAFAVAYLSHLAGDVIYPLVTEGELRAGFLAWPFVSVGSGERETMGLLSHVSELVGEFAAFLATPRGVGYLVVEAVVLGAIALLWMYDGAPGVCHLVRTSRR